MPSHKSPRHIYTQWRRSHAGRDSLIMLHRKQLGLCYHCRQPHPPGEMEIDHLIPLAEGGDPILSSNMVVSCLSCNRKKGATILKESAPLPWWIEDRVQHTP